MKRNQKLKRITAFLLAFAMIFAQFPTIALATGDPVPESVVENITSHESTKEYKLSMPDFDEAEELEALRASAPAFRALDPAPIWDPSQLKVDIALDLKTNPNTDNFLWDQAIEGGSFDVELLYVQEGVEKSVTQTITGKGSTLLLPQLQVYNTDGSKIDYQFQIVLPKDLRYRVILEHWQTSGTYDDLLNPKTYSLGVSLTRIGSTEMEVQWFTNNETNPELIGYFDTGLGQFIPEFKLPQTDLKTIIRSDFNRDLDPDTGQPVFEDKNGDGIIDQPIIAEDDLLGLALPGEESLNWVSLKNPVDGSEVKDGKITVDDKSYFVKVTYDELNGGLYVIREALKVTFDANGGVMDPNPKEVEVAHSEKIPAADVPVDPTPPAGKTFVGWVTNIGTDQEAAFDPETDIVTESMTVKAKYSDKAPVVDEDPNDPDYVKVTFDANGGEFATTVKNPVWALKGTKTADVFTHAGLSIADETGLTPPGAKSFLNYKEGDVAVTADSVIPDVDVTYMADYSDKAPVVDEDPKDPDYVKVTFDANGGEFAATVKNPVWALKGTLASTVFTYAGLTISDETGLTPPAGSVFTVYNDGTADVTATSVVPQTDVTYTANYKDTVIEGDDPNDPIPDGYLRIAFKSDDAAYGGDPARGKLKSTMAGSTLTSVDYLHYDILKGSKFEVVPVPEVVVATGHALKDAPDNWFPYIPAGIQVPDSNSTHTAMYKDILGPYDPADPDTPDVPEGYVTVTFVAGENGSFPTGTKTVYYVNPKAPLPVTFDKLTAPVPTANEGYTFAETWKNKVTGIDITPKFVIKADLTAEANYDSDILNPDDPDTPVPDGYHRLIFKAGENGSITPAEGTNAVPADKATAEIPEGSVIFDVKEGVTFDKIKVPTTTPDQDYRDAGWNPALPEGTVPVEAAETYIAEFTKIDQSLAPTIDQPVVGDEIITGTGVIGATVDVTLPDGSVVKNVPVTEDPDNPGTGIWTVPVDPANPLKKDDVVKATQTEPDKLPSEEVEKTVVDKIIPITPDDPDTPDEDEETPNPDPERFVKVTLNSGLNGNFSGDTAATGEVKEFYVLKDGTVPVADVFTEAGLSPADETGITTVGDFNFDKWDPKAEGNVTEDKTYTATYVAKGQSSTPTIDQPVVGDEEVTGTGTPGADVTVTIPGQDPVTVIVGEDGTWTVPVDPTNPLEPGEKITATQEEPGKLPSEEVEKTVVDKIIPITPDDPDTPDEDEETPNPDPERFVKVTLNSGLNGNFSGDTAATGEVKEFYVLKDGTVPVADVFTEAGLSPADETGITTVGDFNFDKWDPKAEGNVTEDKTYTALYTEIVLPGVSEKPVIDPVGDKDKEITGTGIPGSDIVVTLPDGTELPTTVGDDGTWTVTIPEGTTLEVDDEIKAVQTEKDKDPSEPATTKVIPSVIEVVPGDTPEGYVRITFAPGDHGRIDKSALIDVKKGTEFQYVTVPAVTVLNPAYTHDSWDPDLPEGTATVDEPATYTATYIDKNTSARPTIDRPVTEGDKEINGTGVPGATVTVTLPDDTKIENVPVDEDGNWTATVPEDKELKPGDVIIATQTEPGKQTSSPATAVVQETPQDKTPTPVIDEVKESAAKITGTTEPGATVTILLPDGTGYIGKADEEGKFSIPVDPLKIIKDDTITATAQEEGKAKSDPATTIVQECEDTDGDGLTDCYERNVTYTDPFNRDTDGDRISDYDEHYGTLGYKTDPLNRDTDGDRMGDKYEINAGRNPLVRD
ncbi:MAG: Ig-like domain-containing protein [Tissierellia bacterium]|nr:Ig-like domain-containing protein [Tissierellia bacterium]